MAECGSIPKGEILNARQGSKETAAGPAEGSGMGKEDEPVHEVSAAICSYGISHEGRPLDWQTPVLQM